MLLTLGFRGVAALIAAGVAIAASPADGRAAVAAHPGAGVHNLTALPSGEIVMLEKTASGALDLRVKRRGEVALDRVRLADSGGYGQISQAGGVARLAWLDDGALRVSDWAPRGPLQEVTVRDVAGPGASGELLRLVFNSSSADGAVMGLQEGERGRHLALTRGRDQAAWTLSAPPITCALAGTPALTAHASGRVLAAWACEVTPAAPPATMPRVNFVAAVFDPAAGWSAPQEIALPASAIVEYGHHPDVAWRPDGTGLVAYGSGGAAVVLPGATSFSSLVNASGTDTRWHGRSWTGAAFDVAGTPVLVASWSSGYRWDPVFLETFTGPLLGPLQTGLAQTTRTLEAVNGRGDVLLTDGTLWSRRTAASPHRTIALGDIGRDHVADLGGDDGGLLAAAAVQRPPRLDVVRVRPGSSSVQRATLACGVVEVLDATRHGRRELILAGLRGRLRAFWRLPDGGWRRTDVGAQEFGLFAEGIVASTGDAVMVFRSFGGNASRVVTLAKPAATGRRSPGVRCGRG